MRPWDEISRPNTSNSYSVRLADPDHAYDFYWGKDHKGNLVFRFLGEFDVEPFQDIPQMQGIYMNFGSETEKSHLTLILDDIEDESIFYLLCKSLMEATNVIWLGNDEAAVRVLITHLSRWQRVLQRRKDARELTINEQAGLLGELLVLQNFFFKHLDLHISISSWTGPLDDEQDFSYGDSLVEVKTSRASRDRKIKISSADQLDSVSGQITLVFIGMAQADREHENAMSLNQIVSQIQECFVDDLSTRELFETRLIMRGYEPLPAYDRIFFVPATEQFYSVEGSFPRICSSAVPAGVADVKYSITLESCAPWLISEEQAAERVFSSHG